MNPESPTLIDALQRLVMCLAAGGALAALLVGFPLGLAAWGLWLLGYGR